MAYLYKQKGSSKYYIGWYDKEKKGKGTPVCTKTSNQRDAKIKLNEFERALASKDIKSMFYLQHENRYTLDEAFELFKQDRADTSTAFSKLTIESYNNALTRFKRAVKHKTIGEYTREDYHTFVQSMSGLSQNSKAVYTKRIHALFHWLVKEKFLKENPMKRVSEEDKEFRILTDAEIRAILNYSRETKFHGLVQFVILSAFRIQEALDLRYGDIKENYITVKGKGSKYASIPVLKKMRYLLDTLKPFPANPDERVFPFSYDAAYRFAGRVQSAKHVKFGWHDLRKYCLSTMANAGVPINFVKNYARHSDIKTTIKYYIRVDEARMKDEIDEKVTFSSLEDD
ncbi:MAG: tyrosine-type recombinase/integrase [Bacteroidota bacterium]